jgi:CRISPR system Cascade subunit CasA
MTHRPLNILRDTWLPVRHRSGRRSTIRPAELTADRGDDPIIAPDWPRPDFRLATLEFLIGLLATAAPPRDSDAWLDGWHQPPSPEALDAAFAPIAHAFDLDGDGPRVLQDFDTLPGEPEAIEKLLIEAPGESTTQKNTDLLVKRGRVARLGRPAAAMALFTLQAWAPAGGAGNRTGLRGGGPLITLVRPEAAQSLWHLLWANVPEGRPPEAAEHQRVFPWLAPTLTSESERKVRPDVDAHRLQAFWGMPRRIRLVFEPTPSGPCDLTGAIDDVAVTGWLQRPRGANYAGWGRLHPLSPHYQVKPGQEHLPAHPQPGGIGYRHWLALVQGSGEARIPARCVTVWRAERRHDLGAGRARLLAGGFDMDNMKARAFVETEMPLPAERRADAARLAALAEALVLAADSAAATLRGAVRHALFSAGASVKTDAELLSAARERLWSDTETPFFDMIAKSAEAGGEVIGGAEPERAAWRATLRDASLRIFDEIAPLPPGAPGSSAIRHALGRRELLFTFQGHGTAGAALFSALGLAPPEKRKSTEAA